MPHRPLRSHAARAALGLLLAAIAAGCSTADAPATGDACPPAPGVSPDQLKLGMILPDTGQLAAPFTSARAGVETRIALANEAGGVHGRRITLEWRDDASSGAENLSAARDLVENSDVFGIIETTAVATGSADYLGSLQVPVTGIAAEPAWGEHRNMFSFAYPYTSGPSVTTFGRFAAQAGGTRALVLRSGVNSSAETVAEKMVASLASQGVEVVETVDYTEGVTSDAQVAAAYIAARANVIVGVVSGFGLASVLHAIRAAGATVTAAFGPDGYDSRLVELYGAGMAGMAVYVPTTPFEVESAALDTYRDALVRFAPEQSDRDQVTALQAYISADMFLRGLDAAGACPTREGFVTTLGTSVTDYDADGLLPAPLDFDSGFGKLNECYYFVRVTADGHGFELAPGGGGDDGQQWCGEELDR